MASAVRDGERRRAILWCVANRERIVERGARRGRMLLTQLGLELREARLASGLRLVDVGRATGLDASTVSRIERGQWRRVALETWAELLATVGRDLAVRVYPAGPPIRDAAHLELLGRLRSRLGPGLRLRLEVPLPDASDRRAFDAWIVGLPAIVAVEAETRLRDVQAQVRAARLKQRDGGVPRLLLLVAGSHANRQALRFAAGLLAGEFPVSGRAALRAIGKGDAPGGDAIVVL